MPMKKSGYKSSSPLPAVRNENEFLGSSSCFSLSWKKVSSLRKKRYMNWCDRIFCTTSTEMNPTFVLSFKKCI